MSRVYEIADEYVERFAALHPNQATAMGVPGHDDELTIGDGGLAGAQQQGAGQDEEGPRHESLSGAAPVVRGGAGRFGDSHCNR